MEENGRPLRVIITLGIINDWTKADELTDDIDHDVLVADRGYDTDAIIDNALEQGILPFIVPSSLGSPHISIYPFSFN